MQIVKCLSVTGAGSYPSLIVYVYCQGGDAHMLEILQHTDFSEKSDRVKSSCLPQITIARSSSFIVDSVPTTLLVGKGLETQ